MIWWLLFWLPSLDDGGVVPTPVDLPVVRRDGSQFGALPTIVRRST